MCLFQIYSQIGLIADNDLEAYDNIQNTNARGVLYHTKAALQVMLKQDPVVVQGTSRSRTLGRGSIVNVCSVAGILAPPDSVEYNASKFAAIGITKSAGMSRSPLLPFFSLPFSSLPTSEGQNLTDLTFLAANEYGSSMIRINGICPGPIDTPLLERAVSVNPSFRNAATDSTAFKRLGDVDEVADAILFLVSPAGSYVHGTSMVVDGGYLNMA